MNLRSPVVPAHAYEPPARQDSAPAEHARSLESDRAREYYSGVLPIPSSGLGNPVPGGPQEVTIYKTQAAWRACDVYASLQPGPNAVTAGCLTINVYALVRGQRTLVSSGRLAIDGQADATVSRLNLSKWVAAGRAVCERFEVTMIFTQTESATAIAGTVSFAVVASDEAVDPPWDLGGELSALVNLLNGTAQVRVGPLSPASQVAPRLELLEVTAVCGVAAPRFLHIYDQNSGTVPVNNSRPLAVFPIGAAIGEGATIRYRFRATGVLHVVQSSTLDHLTIAGDGGVSALVR